MADDDKSTDTDPLISEGSASDDKKLSDSAEPIPSTTDLVWYGIILSFFCCPAGVLLFPLMILTGAKNDSFDWLSILRWLFFI